MKLTHYHQIFVILVATIISSAFAANATTYHWTLLAPSAGYTESSGIGMNNSGEVVGECLSNSTSIASEWQTGTNAPVQTVTNGFPQGSWTSLADDQFGTIGGSANAPLVAWRYEQGIMVQLQPGPPGLGAIAKDINMWGTSCGWILSPDPNPANPDRQTASEWITDQPITLPVPPGTQSSVDLAINNSGTSAGYLVTTNGVSEAVRWSGTTNLTLLTGIGGDIFNNATTINQNGDCAGSAGNNMGAPIPVWWPQGQNQAATLPSEATHPYGIINGINNSNSMVGESSDDPFMLGDDEATLYTTNNAVLIKDITENTNGLALNTAEAINNEGDILVNGTVYGKPMSMVLTPVNGKGNTLPTGTITGMQTNGFNVTINLSATDADGYVSAVEVVDTNSPYTAKNTLFTTPYQITVPATNVAKTEFVVIDNLGGQSIVNTTTPMKPTVTVVNTTTTNTTLHLSSTSGVVLQYSPDGTTWVDCDVQPLQSTMIITKLPGMNMWRLITRTNTKPLLSIYDLHWKNHKLFGWASSTNDTEVLMSTDLEHWSPYTNNILEIPFPMGLHQVFLRLTRAPATLGYVKLIGNVLSAEVSSTNSVITWFSTDLIHWTPIATNVPTVSITTRSPEGFLKTTRF